jgi:hypothetical protein
MGKCFNDRLAMRSGPAAVNAADLAWVVVQVTVKGCRSEVKVYTDLSVGLKSVGGAFGVGLQPTIGLVRLTGGH